MTRDRHNILMATLGLGLLVAFGGPVSAQTFTPFGDPNPLAPPAASRPRPARRVAPPAPVETRGPVSETAGRYGLLRGDDKKDTGCLLTLDGAARSGGGRAVLAPACRDQGLVIFDPVGWSLERGRLSLRARKGHHALFDLQSDGTWVRDPKEGKPLILRKIVV